VHCRCLTGSVKLGHYAVGHALKGAGAISGADMTLEAVSCKLAYLFGRGDLTNTQIAQLMGVPLRGEITPNHHGEATRPFETACAWPSPERASCTLPRPTDGSACAYTTVWREQTSAACARVDRGQEFDAGRTDDRNALGGRLLW
jgi:hypothetical protein